MHVQDLKRWHWILIAIGVGLALSYVWSNVEWGQPLPTIGQPDFERGLVRKYPAQGHLQKISVMPILENHYKVLCEQLKSTTDPHKMRYRGVAFMSDVPFKSDRLGKTFPNVMEYLKAVQAENIPGADASFSYAWYRETWAVYALWTGMSILLIGGVWPSIVSLMTGAGLGLRLESKEPEYDLDRFGKYKEPEKPKPAKPSPGTNDLDDLRRLDDELEKRLAAGATVGSSTTSVADSSETPTRKLDGGPLQLLEIQKEQETKEYGGEFYPVVKTIHKNKEDHDPHA